MEREANIGIVNAQEPTPKSKEDKFQNTIAFLKTAIAERAHLKRPFFWIRGISIKQIPEEAWVRQRNIIGIYFGSPAVLEDIRIMYGITRERIRGIKKRGMLNLWKNCSLETQTIFPFQEIALDKPRSQRSKERISKGQGGRTIFFRDQVKTGRTIRQIKESGISIKQIARARIKLGEWGTQDVPYIITPHSQNLELEKNLKKAETDKEKQEFLNQVKYRFYSLRVRENDPLLISIEDTVKGTGLSLGWQRRNFVMFYASLKNVGFPMGEIHEKKKSKIGEEKIIRYHFLLAKDKERAKQILLDDPNLQRFRRS